MESKMIKKSLSNTSSLKVNLPKLSWQDEFQVMLLRLPGVCFGAGPNFYKSESVIINGQLA